MNLLRLAALCCLMAGISACQPKGGEVLFVLPDKYQGVIKILESPEGVKADTHSGVAKLVIPSNGMLPLKDTGLLRSWHKLRAVYLGENTKEIPVITGAQLNEPDSGLFSLGSWGDSIWFFVGTRDEWKHLRETRSFLDADRKEPKP